MEETASLFPDKAALTNFTVNILTQDYDKLPQLTKLDIVSLLQLVWPDSKTELPVHWHDLHVYSFCLNEGTELLGYAGVVRKTIHSDDEMFYVVSLTCMAVHPNDRKQGYGKQLMAAIMKWLRDHHTEFDFGIFTCDPSCVAFYEQFGWKARSDMLVKGNTKDHAYTSEHLHVIVMYQPFRRKNLFQNCDIKTVLYLGLPDQQFL